MFSQKPKFIKLPNLDLLIFDVIDILYNPETDLLFPYIYEILEDLKKIGYKLAILSYNVNTFFILERFNIIKFFDFIEIEDYWKMFWQYKSKNLYLTDDKIHIKISNYKTLLFKNLIEKSKINITKILNFDSEYKYIYNASVYGIFSILIDGNGLTSKIINKGFSNFLSTDNNSCINPNYLF